MITIRNTTVYPNFDSGKFMNSFTIVNKTESWSQSEQNIQQKYNLDFDDFNALSLLIASTVEKYLSGERTTKKIFTENLFKNENNSKKRIIEKP